jgi:hypothetical protein
MLGAVAGEWLLLRDGPAGVPPHVAPAIFFARAGAREIAIHRVPRRRSHRRTPAPTRGLTRRAASPVRLGALPLSGGIGAFRR